MWPVDGYLVLIGQNTLLLPWKRRQFVGTVQNLYSIVDTYGAQGVAWDFWRGSPRPLEEHHANAARELALVTPEEFAKRIGELRFVPLIREHVDVFARFSTFIRTRGLSIRTEKSCRGWCARFLSRFGSSGPEHLGASDVATLLETLSLERKVSACTQSQAINTLVLLCEKVQERPLAALGSRRTRAPRRPPVVLSQSKVKRLLDELRRPQWLNGPLPYSTEMRLMEGLRLRVHDLDLDRALITVRRGKGSKDPIVPRP